MRFFMALWLKAAAEADALRAQVAVLEVALGRAEGEADYWYFEANNPDAAAERRRALSSSAPIDVRTARHETAERWAARAVRQEAQAS